MRATPRAIIRRAVKRDPLVDIADDKNLHRRLEPGAR